MYFVWDILLKETAFYYYYYKIIAVKNKILPTET